MKVTTELKNLIKCEFEKKRTNLQLECKEKGKQKFNDMLHMINEDDDFIMLNGLAKKVYDKFIDTIPKNKNNPPYYESTVFNLLQSLTANNLLYDNSNSYYRYGEINKKYINDLALLNRQEQMLLIKLTYEKDMDSVMQLLNDFGIALYEV